MLGFALTRNHLCSMSSLTLKDGSVPGVFRLDDAISWTAPPAVGNKSDYCNFHYHHRAQYHVNLLSSRSPLELNLGEGVRFLWRFWVLQGGGAAISLCFLGFLYFRNMLLHNCTKLNTHS